MKSLIETKRHDLQEKIKIVYQLHDDYAKVMKKGEDLKRDVQEFVDNLFATVEAKKQAIFGAVAEETRKSCDPQKNRDRTSNKVNRVIFGKG